MANAQLLKTNIIYLELGGASKYYSVNYERLWLSNDNHNITTRAGIMYLYVFDGTDHTIAGAPISASYLKKINNEYLEAGISFAIIRDMYTLDSDLSQSIYVEELILMPSIRIGVRHQPTEKNLFWNLLAQISMSAHSETEKYIAYTQIFPLFSAGIGYSF